MCCWLLLCGVRCLLFVVSCNVLIVWLMDCFLFVSLLVSVFGRLLVCLLACLFVVLFVWLFVVYVFVVGCCCCLSLVVDYCLFLCM